MLNCFLFVYLKDILIFSWRNTFSMCFSTPPPTGEQALCKGKKCEFYITSVSFLGFIIEQWQVKTNPSKVQAVADWPTPQAATALPVLRQFYRHFYQEQQPDGISSHQTDLSAIPFTWTSEVETAFHTLKQLFTDSCSLMWRWMPLIHG